MSSIFFWPFGWVHFWAFPGLRRAAHTISFVRARDKRPRPTISPMLAVQFLSFRGVAGDIFALVTCLLYFCLRGLHVLLRYPVSLWNVRSAQVHEASLGMHTENCNGTEESMEREIREVISRFLCVGGHSPLRPHLVMMFFIQVRPATELLSGGLSLYCSSLGLRLPPAHWQRLLLGSSGMHNAWHSC